MKSKIFEWSIIRFNVSKLKNLCNVKNCQSKPIKELTVFEYALNKRTDILTIYLCSVHSNEINSYVKSLREIAPNMILEKSVKTI